MSANELILQAGITAINWGTIKNAEGLNRIVIPDSCMAIDNNAFPVKI